MYRTLNFQWLRRLSVYFRPRNVNIRLRVNNLKTYYFYKASKTLVGSQICKAALTEKTVDKIDIDNDLRKACEEGDAAIIKLMDQLMEFVTIVSREYRSCITKQIEITKNATNIGPLSEKWDELPKYRILADELYKELADYMTLFKMIGEMAHENSLIHFVRGNNDNLDSISTKYKELEIVLEWEFEQNRKFEVKLLETKRDSILNSATS